MAVSYIIDYARLEGMTRRAAFNLIRRAANETRDQAKRNVTFRKHPGVPPRPIGLAQSIFASVKPTATGYSARVGSYLSYAASVEEGATPHIITPRAGTQALGGQLVFWWTKRNVLFKGPVVHHPGQKGKFYLRRALLQVAPRYGFRVIVL